MTKIVGATMDVTRSTDRIQFTVYNPGANGSEFLFDGIRELWVDDALIAGLYRCSMKSSHCTAIKCDVPGIL